MRNAIALLLVLVSFALLAPGIWLPVLTIKGSITLPLIGTMELGSETRSILGTVRYLYDMENHLVASLILLFSVVIPVLKGLLLLFVLFFKKNNLRKPVLELIRRIGKWSMADVFVVAIFLAYLATASMQVFKAHMERGFYFFLGYCLVSVLSTEFILLRNKAIS